MTLDELKLYLRVDGTEDDNIISSLQLAAEEYLINAGITKDYNKELYKLAIELLVSNWYENRSITNEKTMAKVSFSLDTIIAQLKYS